ncbi:MAG: glycosyltransferase family 2 protein [Candidatus Methanomethylicia archaeon]
MLTLILLTILAIPFSLHTLGTISLILNLRRKVWLKPKLNSELKAKVALLIPLYKEKAQSIEKTFRSITKQMYDKSMMRTLIIVENGDEETIKNVMEKCRILDEGNIKYEIIVHPETRSSKAKSLNYALKYVDEPFIVVYDADDEIVDPYQIAKGISLMNDEKYDSVGVKVLRVGNRLPQIFSYVETCLWVNIALPALKYISQYPMYSGEGLFISTKTLKDIGGFPETLTEDSMLAVEFAKRRLKMALMDSIVYESGPYTLKSLIKQRMRWNRGLIECFKEIIKNEGIPLKVKVVNGLYYLSPISYTIISIASIYLAIIPILKFLGIEVDYTLLYLCIYLIISVLISPLFLIITGVKIPDKRALIISFPMWILIGLITIYSIISPRIEWYKTERLPAKEIP